jgi:hypothetical protein
MGCALVVVRTISESEMMRGRAAAAGEEFHGDCSIPFFGGEYAEIQIGCLIGFKTGPLGSGLKLGGDMSNGLFILAEALGEFVFTYRASIGVRQA